MRPLIGITPDYLSLEEVRNEQCYILRENYLSALSKHGATCVILPHDDNSVESLVEKLDGLLFTGGNHDIDPKCYGEVIKSDTVTLNNKRTNFEMDLFKKFFATGKPILGICGGQQLINVCLGGSLIQHIPDEIDNHIEHSRSVDRKQFCHSVIIKKDTLLYKILKTDKIEVNTSHHQAVKKLGSNVICNSIATDQVIEGIEIKGHKFCLGVQWHPEYLLGDNDEKIFKFFVNSCITGR